MSKQIPIPYRTPAGEMLQISIRLHTDPATWVCDLAAKEDATLSATLMQIVEDFRTWWGLDPKLVALLRADAKALGLNTAGYLYFLLREEARELLEQRKKKKG